LNNLKLSEIFDKFIIVFLTIQIASVNFSIALSSISFGIWAGLWLIQIVLERSIRYDKRLFSKIKVINFFILLYFFFEIFSRFFAVMPGEEFIGLKRLLLFLIFFVSMIKIADRNTLFKILFVILCTASIISIYELVEYVFKLKANIDRIGFGLVRIDFFAYPLTTGQIKMLLFFSILPVLFVKEKFIINRKYLFIILFPIFLSMVLTQSRNVFLAVFIALIIFGIFYNRKFLLSFVIVLILAWIFVPSEYQSRIKSIGDTEHPSNKSRLMMWDVGMKMFFEHPLTGVADSHIKEVYKLYKTPESEAEGSHLHNNFIMILATTGIFGFLSYVGMLLSIFIFQIKAYLKEKESEVDKALLLGSILVMISFNVAGLFEWCFGDHEVMTVFFFLISIPFIIYKINFPRKYHTDN
jgi:O-antigen ligase